MLLQVAPSGEMDDETFVKHWNMRHAEDSSWSTARVDGALVSTRAFHRRQHAVLGHDSHAHREPL